VIGGSITATLVTFFLLPTAYATMEQWRNRRMEQVDHSTIAPLHHSSIPPSP
jgi:hypothetical protein